VDNPAAAPPLQYRLARRKFPHSDRARVRNVLAASPFNKNRCYYVGMALKKGHLIGYSVLPVLFLCFFFLPHTVFAALSIDGTDSVDAGYGSSNFPAFITLSTTLPNDVIILEDVDETDGGAPTPPATITSISDTAGLIWHERTATTSPSMVGWSGSLAALDTEIWWAYAPSPLSSDTITPTYTGGTLDCNALVAFGVNGANTDSPWDANGSLPQIAINTSATYLGGTDADPSVSVSTNAANTMLLGFVGTPYYGVDDGGYGASYNAGSGYTDLAYQQGGDCSDAVGAGAEYQVVSTAQSNTTVNFTPPGQGWFMIGDAIQAAGGGGGGGGGGGTGRTPRF
jgi:hypothetical protein